MPSTTATHSIALLSSRQVPGPNGQGRFFTAHTSCCSAAGRFDSAQQASLCHTKATAGELSAPPAGSRTRLGGTLTCPGTGRRPHKGSLATLAPPPLAKQPAARQVRARGQAWAQAPAGVAVCGLGWSENWRGVRAGAVLEGRGEMCSGFVGPSDRKGAHAMPCRRVAHHHEASRTAHSKQCKDKSVNDCRAKLLLLQAHTAQRLFRTALQVPQCSFNQPLKTSRAHHARLPHHQHAQS